MHTYTIGIDFGAGESVSRAWSANVKNGINLADLVGETGALILVPLKGQCAKGHENTALISPHVILTCDDDAWRTQKCSKCRSRVTMRPDFERVYGKQP